MRQALAAISVLAAFSLSAAGCGSEGDGDDASNIDSAEAGDVADVETGGDDGGEAPDSSDAVDGASEDADAPERDTAETDEGGDGGVDADADVDIDGDTSSPTATDLDAAALTMEGVFAVLGLNPNNALDVRRVWTDEELYLEYLRAWGDAVGVTFPEAGGSKALCASLTGFDPTVPYCGPGCGNDVTLAPPCLNQACFEHDACYAAYECDSGNAVDVGLSFGPLMVCCDEPLNTIWSACVGSVAAEFVAGRIGIADVALFNAVSALMLAMNNLSVLDAPTDLTPWDCSRSFEEACGNAELVLTVTPTRVSEEGGASILCATLQRDGSDVLEWTLDARTDGPGSVAPASAVSAADGLACVTYTAPSELPDGETTVSITLEATAAATLVATRVAAVTLVGAMPELVVDGPSTRTFEAGDPAFPLCFLARIGDEPQAGVPVTFTIVGSGALVSSTGDTNSSGRVCVSYRPPAEATGGIDVVTAAGEVDGRSVSASVFVTIEEFEPSPEAVWVGTVDVSMNFLSVQPYNACPEMEDNITATATMRVECNAAVPGAGGSCSIVSGNGQMEYYRGHPAKPNGQVYGGTGRCETDGTCSRGGTCYVDRGCTCAPLFCSTTGLCGTGAGSGASRIEFRASGALENELGGAILTFSDAGAGEVTGTVANVLFEREGFGGTYHDAPSFTGDVSSEDQEAWRTLYVDNVGPFLAEASLYSGSSGTATFVGTATEDTITASWVDPGFRVVSPPNGLLEGGASAVISLRRVR